MIRINSKIKILKSKIKQGYPTDPNTQIESGETKN
jgi:hypothetical protein